MAFSVRRSEQLSTVAQSDVLIGMHGAGMTHLGKKDPSNPICAKFVLKNDGFLPRQARDTCK